nr:hypothetical protein [Tanacetum cinerariifolium]
KSSDSGFARFNTILTSLKALDEGFSIKNYVRKFLRALHPKWREKDFEICKGKKKRVKSIALKVKKDFSDDETSTCVSEDEKYATTKRDFKKFFRRKGRFAKQPRDEKKSFSKRDEMKSKSDQKYFRCGEPNHLIGECPKPPRNKDQKAFVEGSWSDSENEDDKKPNEKLESTELAVYSIEN